jgi:hypothetical protein
MEEWNGGMMIELHAEEMQRTVGLNPNVKNATVWFALVSNLPSFHPSSIPTFQSSSIPEP